MKQYIKPQMETIEMKSQAPLMQPSLGGEYGGGQVLAPDYDVEIIER